MKLYKVCIDHHDRNFFTTCCDREFFSDLELVADFILKFEDHDNWELRIFPVDAKIKYSWSKDYDES